MNDFFYVKIDKKVYDKANLTFLFCLGNYTSPSAIIGYLETFFKEAFDRRNQ